MRLLTLLLVPALAAAEPPEVTWPEAAYNPSPLPGDLTLPMPCGGAMVFRPVPAGPPGTLQDLTVELGSDDAEGGFTERRYRTHVGGPFQGGDGRYLLMGKYEVGALQYQTLPERDQTCPQATGVPSAPRVNLSWHDATAFAHRYSLWLARNAERFPACAQDTANTPHKTQGENPAVPCLPRQDGISAFVRLPIEEEWELAARGAAKVSPSEFRAPTYSMPDGMERHVWFSANADGEVKPIGLRRPNPLGLFDMFGNAEEMTLEPFRLRMPDRLHGQAGGFVVRGGSIRSAKNEIRASLRREVPYYDQGGPVSTPDTGFRLVASLPLFTSNERLLEIRDAWARLGDAGSEESGSAVRDQAPAPEPRVPSTRPPATDALAELAAMSRETRDPDARQRLERLRSLVAAERDRSREQRLRAAREGLRFGGLTCSKLHDEGHNLELLRASLRLCIENRGKNSPRCMRRAQQLERDERIMRENIRFHADTVVSTAQTYAKDASVLAQAFDALADNLAQRGYSRLQVYPQTFLEQIKDYDRSGAARADAWFEQCTKLTIAIQ